MDSHHPSLGPAGAAQRWGSPPKRAIRSVVGCPALALPNRPTATARTQPQSTIGREHVAHLDVLLDDAHVGDNRVPLRAPGVGMRVASEYAPEQVAALLDL